MLERILSAMFEEAGLAPRLNYRPKGEEIDGSIWFHGRTILVEAKWTGDPHPASSLYQFKGKVDGKLVGTLGLFVSIGGFSTDSVDALVAGKELNLILADGDDMRSIVENEISVVEALERKLRAAGDAGTPFLQLTAPVDAPSTVEGRRIVVVEGRSDVQFFESVRRVYGATAPVVFVPASGPMNMVPVTRLMLEVTGSVAGLAVVVDGDLEGRALEKLRDDMEMAASDFGLEPNNVSVIAVQPDTEVALGLADPEVHWNERRQLRKLSDDALDARVAAADVLGRASENPSLAMVLEMIGVGSSI
jgi:hypothetical protein